MFTDEEIVAGVRVVAPAIAGAVAARFAEYTAKIAELQGKLDAKVPEIEAVFARAADLQARVDAEAGPVTLVQAPPLL